MTIYANRYYVLESIPGISGFQRWHEREYRIVTGTKARRERHSVVAEWTPCSDERYALEDGHLPEHQPEADPAGVVCWLRSNPSGCARAIGRAHDRLIAHYHHLATA